MFKKLATSASVPGSSAGEDILDSPTCRHQWLIETPDGPSSKGVCRICGEQGEFQNYIEGSAWGYEISLEQLSGGTRLPGVKEVHENIDDDDD